MRRWRGLGLLLLAGGLASLGWGALQGELQVALFLVFPVVYGSGAWGVLGIGLVMAGVFALFVDAAARLGPPAGGTGRSPGGGFGGRDPAEPGPGSGDEPAPWDDADEGEEGGWLSGGGVIMLGPIPIVLGSDKRTTMILMALAVLLMAMGLAWLVLVGG